MYQPFEKRQEQNLYLLGASLTALVATKKEKKAKNCYEKKQDRGVYCKTLYGAMRTSNLPRFELCFSRKLRLYQCLRAFWVIMLSNSTNQYTKYPVLPRRYLGFEESRL